MKSRPSSHKAEFIDALVSFILPALVTLFIWLTRANEVTIIQGLIAFILLYLPWQTFRSWRKGNRGEIPMFPMIASMFWLYYALPLFWGEKSKLDFSTIGNDLTDESITQAMILVLFGVSALWLGMRSRLGQFLVPRNIPDIHSKLNRWGYLRLILVIGILGNLYQATPYLLGEGGRQIIIILLTIVPMVAFAILFRNFVRGESNRLDKILIATFIFMRILTSLSSGWLGSAVMLLIVCAAIYVSERRKLPRWVVVFTILYILFLQPGKMAVREKYWYGGQDGTQIEKAAFWIENSVSKWADALDDPTGQAVRDIGYQSLSRTSLLTQTANVLQLTPAVVPYQYGQLYSYAWVTLIPRFVWPDKPSVNESNRFYQVAYGLTSEDNLNSVSIAVGFLTESYISFGWPGVFIIMFLVGGFFSFFQKTFLGENSGILFKGIGLALLPQFLNIEAQLAQYLFGITQQILLTLLVFLPLIKRNNHRMLDMNVPPNFNRARLINRSGG